ncbi:MAG: hypothetical protein MUO62_18725 [Anaerolineales bacterium]|nr:hypothetical protein [Anaerolineales bacterium]
MPSNGFIEAKPPLRRELLAAMVIFLVPLFAIFEIPALSLPHWIDYLLVILILGLLLFALGLAMFTRLPPWALPYLGLLLLPGILFSQVLIGNSIYPFFTQSFGPMSSWSLPLRITYAGIFELLIWFLVLLSALVLVNLLRLQPRTRGVWQRIRADWTQLSFLLYGSLVAYILLTFEAYRYEELWKSIAWMCLALGAWLYLRARRQKQRIRVLIIAATAAMLTTTLAKWMLVPLQKWPIGYPFAPSLASRWIETGVTFISWIGILFVLMAPALLNFLPSSPPPDVQQEIAPA